MLYSPALFERAHLEIFGCSPGFGEFADLGRQGKNLILHLTAEILLGDFKRRESIKNENKKAAFMCKVFCVVTGHYTGVTSCVQLILHI